MLRVEEMPLTRPRRSPVIVTEAPEGRVSGPSDQNMVLSVYYMKQVKHTIFNSSLVGIVGPRQARQRQ